MIKDEESEVIQKMDRDNIDVLGLSEMKARGNCLKVIVSASYVYLGVTEGRVKRGVAINVKEGGLTVLGVGGA